MAFLSAWSGLACAGGQRLGDVEFTAFEYGSALDNTQGCKLTVRADDTVTLGYLAMANVLRVTNELGTTAEYLINNLQLERINPSAVILGKPVEFLLNNVLVKASNAGRVSTAVSGTYSAADWRDLFLLPSLAAYGQSWWTAGTLDLTAFFTLKFVDQTCMWMIRELLKNETAVLRARRNGETGYFLDLVDLTVATSPLALVGANVVALSRAIDDTEQANVIVPAGQQFSGNDEPERVWYTPFRAASLSGAVVTLDDPSGLNTTILGSNGQASLAGMRWRLGAVTPPVYWNGATNYVSNYGLFRTVYLQSAKLLWGVFFVGQPGIMSLNVETRVQGTRQTTSLTGPKDAAYTASTDTLYVVDAGGNQVTPYTTAGPTAGTPIAVGTTPRRILWVSDGALNRYLIGHSGSNAVKQIDPTSNTVTATSPAMTTPAHLDTVTKTQVYVASDSADAVYRYNASANTLTTTITNGASAGYAALAFVPTTLDVWAFQRTIGTVPPTVKITIIDTTTDLIKLTLTVSGVHGVVQDCVVLNGNLYGVTDDGLLVCYSGVTHTLQWMRRHAVWSASVALWSITYLSDLDCFAIGSDSAAVYFMDAQTGGAMVARGLTAANAATPSVTLANSVFPLRQYDEVVFARDDGDPLAEIPNEVSVLTYGAKMRQVLNPQLSGGSNRVLNGSLTWFDASRKVARFLNLKLPDATSEARWDSYTDNTVTSFTAAMNGAQTTATGVPQSLVVKSAGANRVFLPGDILVGGVDFMVLAKATTDGSGNVTLYVAPTNPSGVANNDATTVNRPTANTVVPAFTAAMNGAQATTAGVTQTLNVKSAGAARVFLPGDQLIGGTNFTVLTKATADATGVVTLSVTPTNNAGVANNDPTTVYRPVGNTMLASASTLVALPQVAIGAGGARSVLFADVNLPYIPGEMTNLYWGMTAWVSGVNGNPSQWRVRVIGLDRRQALLDVYPNPDTVSLSGRGLVPMSFTGSIPLPVNFAGGHVQFNIQPIDNVGGGVIAMTLYVANLWVQVGNADRGPPNTDVYDLWQLGQDTGVDRGSPLINYTVQVVENDPTNPFLLGAKVTLRDPEQNIAATPAIVNIVRTLPRTPDEIVQPVLTLDNRDPSFVRRLVETGFF